MGCFAVPSQIGHLTNLIRLNLQDNYLTGSIPFDVIGSLSSLTELCVRSRVRLW
jgi:hypothetical protein